MAQSTVDTARVLQFEANVVHLVQQLGTRYRGLFPEVEVVGKRRSIERLGSSDVNTKTARNQAIDYINPAHTRRWLSTKTYYWSALIDKEDLLRVLIDPQSEYARNAAWAMGRNIDQVLINAFDATVATGEDADGSQSFDTSNQQIAAGSAGLTIDKLRQAKQKLDVNEVDPSLRRYFLCSSKQIENLLGTTEVTSADFNSVRALVNGEVNSFMGFEFIRSELLDKNSNDRDCYAVVEDCMRLGIGRDIITKMTEVNTLVSHPTQIYFEMDLGAVRVQETNIVKVICDESV